MAKRILNNHKPVQLLASSLVQVQSIRRHHPFSNLAWVSGKLLMVQTEMKSAAAPSKGSERKTVGRFDRLLVGVSIVGLAVLCFFGGSAVAEFRLFPYEEVLGPSFEAARSIKQQFETTSSVTVTDQCYPTQLVERGVVRHASQHSFDGLTVFTSGDHAGAFLIDMNGQQLHEWRVPFRSVWPNAPHVDHPVDEDLIFWRRAHVFANGDVIGLFEAIGDTPWGYGLVKVDHESNVIWKYADHVHHDLEVQDDGGVLALTHDFRDTHTEPPANVKHLARRVLDDFVVQLSPDGVETRRVSVLDAFADSNFHHVFDDVSTSQWDAIHTNTVKLITPEFAAHHDGFEAGQVLISCRTLQLLAVLDMSTERIVWASCGPYRRQHDPDLLANGNLLLFDNRGHTGAGGASRIIEFNPLTDQIHWAWGGDQTNWFYSKIRGCQQPLPNGNVLVSEPEGGRLIEVTRKGEVVWEFRNPATIEANGTLHAVIACGATRHRRDDLRFKFNNATHD